MKPLSSPFTNGQITRKWYHQILTPRQQYISALQEQISERGKTHDEDWKTPKHVEVSNRIKEILRGICWEVELDFAPQDPWFIVGECEIGDLSEVEVLMDIEKEFKVRLRSRDDLGLLTFLDIVNLIVQPVDADNQITRP
jgi:hypothetical protein